MQKKTSKHNEKQKPNWDWTHVQCYLKTVQANRKSTIWNLAPSIILTNPSTESSGPNVRLYIDTEKSLQYSNDLGWNWHKSWNIPNISLRLQIKDQGTGDFLLSPRNLYAQIFAVKKNTQNQKTDRMTLIDVGIRGQSKMQMIDGQVYFSAIKFSSTTYNNQGINFNLLIVLYINEGEFEKPKVLTAVISPPIFVDSRRSARDYQQKKFSSFVQPFGYDNLEKQFIKRENKSKCESEIVIKNDPEGFYNYITAPNIRHKVKHPVFLAIKFSNCVRIYYNTKLVNANNVNQLLENMQSKLLKQNKSKQKTDVELATNLEEKHFIFVISNLTDSLKRKKVLQSIQTMQNQFIGISCGTQDLLDFLVPMGTIESLKKAYKETYESLITICQNYQPQYQEESQDEYYSQQYDESQKSSVKKKREVVEPRNNTRNKTTIISNKNINAPPQKPLKTEKNQQIILKKQQLFDSQFQAPVFFNHQNQQNVRKNAAASAFSKAVGFRNVGNPSENNPVFDTSQLNKAFSNNLANIDFADPNQANFLADSKNGGFKSAGKAEANLILGQNNQLMHGLAPAQGMGMSQGGQGAQGGPGLSMGLGMGQSGYGSSLYDNLMYSNLTLSNWLSSVKGNNNSLYDSMLNNSLSDQLMHKNNLQRYLQTEQQQKMLELGRMPLQNEEQQSIVCLIQQISLYKELLSQVTYQNQLLSRDITYKQQQQNTMGQFGGMQSMQGMGYLTGLGGMNLASMGNMGSMGNTNMGNMGSMSNMGGMGMGGMGNMANMGSMGSMGNMNSMASMNNNGLGTNGMSNMNNLSLSGVSQGLLGNNLLNNQMNLVSNLMLNQNNRTSEQTIKEKDNSNNMSQSMASNNNHSLVQSGINSNQINQTIPNSQNMNNGQSYNLNQSMSNNLPQSMGNNHSQNMSTIAQNGGSNLASSIPNILTGSAQSLTGPAGGLGTPGASVGSGVVLSMGASSSTNGVGLSMGNILDGVGIGSLGASNNTPMMNMNMSPHNYEIIKNMVMQQMKREAEIKERERQESSK